MPILTVEIALRPGESLRHTLASELAECAGEIFASPPAHTWVILRPISSEHYAENGSVPQETVHPVFVSILKAQLPAPEQLHAEVARLTHAIAQVSGRAEELVHIIYLPAGAGRVAFGGKLV